MNKMKTKSKGLESPWITKGIIKKKEMKKRKKNTKIYKKLFESIQKRSKRLYFSKLILQNTKIISKKLSKSLKKQ